MANITSAINATLQRIKDPIIQNRLMMVRDAFHQPLRDVAASYGCAHGKVDYWKKRYEQLGVRGLYTKKQQGRPKKITLEQEKKLRRVVRRHNIKQGWQTKQVRQLIHDEAGVKYSFRHTIRITQSWGLGKIKPRPRYAFSKQEDRADFIKKTKNFWHVNR
ncbi:helix-turn-helix domain-containing protein [Patescibacteria group bacterium]|nr:helix-turn-helix domain-containing protein [Patescibacteria group bacterium]